MDPLFTPASIDPTQIKISTYNRLNADFDFDGGEEQQSTPPEQPPVRRHRGKSIVIKSAEYAVKILQDSDPDLQNELSVSSKLNALSQENLTHVFNFTNGYIFALDLPPNIAQLEPISLHKPGFGYVKQTPQHYIYLFSSKIDHEFASLPDEEKVNENFFFEVLIGLFFARLKFRFCHWDIHEKNLMFNESSKVSSRTYRINTFYVTIADTRFEPKLIDYGKSVIDVEYTDKRWQEPRFKKQWNKSDVYHLALIFSRRNNLSDRFRRFLKEEILIKYADAMYASKLQNDSAANHRNIENLLKSYFGASTTLNCMMCGLEANFVDEQEHHYYCTKDCAAQFFSII